MVNEYFKIEDPIVYYKSSENMNELKDNSIQLIITSPPYGKIKDYETNEQIGYYDTFEEYFERLKKVWIECYRVLEPKCRLIINVGDQYLRTTKFGRYRILSIASRIINDCLNIDFDFLGDIIWQKISTTNTTGGCSLMGSIYYPRNGLLTFDYEHILIFKKQKGKKTKIDLEKKEFSKISLSEWKKWYIGHWNFPGIIQKEHLAMFPEELPYRLIRMFSFVGDNILDPFVGSGTTLKVAKSLFRRGIGYEINKEYDKIINKKIDEAKIGYFNDYQYLIYNLFLKSKKEHFSFEFEKQRQKGIIILKNTKNIEIIIDYLLLDKTNDNNQVLLKEIQSKVQENSVQNYLKENDWYKQISNYIIIINSQDWKNKNIINQINEFIKNKRFSKKINSIDIQKFLSDHFLIDNLFSD